MDMIDIGLQFFIGLPYTEVEVTNKVAPKGLLGEPVSIADADPQRSQLTSLGFDTSTDLNLAGGFTKRIVQIRGPGSTTFLVVCAHSA